MQNSRRDFFRYTLGSAAMGALAQKATAQQTGNGLPTRKLGRTGEQVSILCLGGFHPGSLGAERQAESIRILHTAIDEGINFFDNAWMYNDGYSEEVMGIALKGSRRKQVFLMTKNSGRDYKFSKQCLEDSLRRLQTDYLDLWQFHEINYDNDPEWVFERGAMKAALEARKEGKVRHIGFTGHKDPRIHLKMLSKPFDWATSQMPINIMDHFYRSFQRQVIPVCLERDVGIIGMKSLGGGVGKIPNDTKITAEQCVRFALSLPISSLCRGYTSVDQLRADIKVARTFRPLTHTATSELLALAEAEAGDGRQERFKATQEFDGAVYRKMGALGGAGARKWELGSFRFFWGPRRALW
ncbi:MAG: aldo/keto reductase, partial [bacterium]|nr:aldo/keto reductase [bacterium]